MKTIKRGLAIVMATALSMSVSGLTFAQDRDHRGDRGDARGDRHDDRRDDRRDDNHRDGPPRGVERGAGPQHEWRRGGRLPPQYHTRQYIVNDWRARHLSAPPRGYHWVQNGSDFVLVAIATGIIAQVLLGNN